MNKAEIWDQIEMERERQDKKFPLHKNEWTSRPEVKYLVLAEEVGEVAEAMLHADKENLIEELIQVAAVCVKWLESIEKDVVEGYHGEDTVY